MIQWYCQDYLPETRDMRWKLGDEYIFMHCISAFPFIFLRQQYYMYAQCNEGVCFIGEELENVTESIVSEGLVEVRRGGIKPSE